MLNLITLLRDPNEFSKKVEDPEVHYPQRNPLKHTKKSF